MPAGDPATDSPSPGVCGDIEEPVDDPETLRHGVRSSASLTADTDDEPDVERIEGELKHGERVEGLRWLLDGL